VAVVTEVAALVKAAAIPAEAVSLVAWLVVAGYQQVALALALGQALVRVPALRLVAAAIPRACQPTVGPSSGPARPSVQVTAPLMASPCR
jgi:ABC-type Fe3+ transport system substrate-binding protein